MPPARTSHHDLRDLPESRRRQVRSPGIRRRSPPSPIDTRRPLLDSRGPTSHPQRTGSGVPGNDDTPLEDADTLAARKMKLAEAIYTLCTVEVPPGCRVPFDSQACSMASTPMTCRDSEMGDADSVADSSPRTPAEGKGGLMSLDSSVRGSPMTTPGHSRRGSVFDDCRRTPLSARGGGIERRLDRRITRSQARSSRFDPLDRRGRGSVAMALERSRLSSTTASTSMSTPSIMGPPDMSRATFTALTHRPPPGPNDPLILPPECVAKFLDTRNSRPRKHGGRRMDFRPGMIIEAPMHEEDWASGAKIYKHRDTLNPHYSISASFAGYVHTKVRKFVVAEVFDRHYIALPIYTHQGRGCADRKDKIDFVSIHDSRNIHRIGPGAQSVVQLTNWTPLVTDNMKAGSQIIDKVATVHITYPVSRSVDIRVNYVGDLKRESTDRLRGMFRDSLCDPNA